MDLRQKLREFSHAGIRKHPTKSSFLFGLECAGWSWRVVEICLSDQWLGDASNVAHLRKVNWNLGMVVGEAVSQHTKNDFDWATVTGIVDMAGRHKLSKAHIRLLESEYPLGLHKATGPEGFGNVKHLVQQLAKSALWVEAVSFLEYEGYGDRLKK